MIRKSCSLDTDFQRSITFQRNIEVWIEQKLVIMGRVESFTVEAVRIEGTEYPRNSCEFIMV
ncbi:hypothetical protein [Paenibacillus antarcticus]|uniref:Uncharacterized protein n=1 Tax=Paenibacillus antarcticus TaxID=253703 RepID=A0A168QM45_9BACL|nr:hypothetical protein [Paenibacillus antarcticus]OAB47946.1 hypothetical protein PBAT_03470 [Paenibacillus antarcticus]